MESQQLWKLAVLDTSDNTEKNFLLKALDYKKEKLIEILTEIHPEYDDIRLSKMDT